MNKKYTNEELLKTLVLYVKNYDKIPTQKEFKKCYGLHSRNVYEKRFGNIYTALQKAGLIDKFGNQIKFSDEIDMNKIRYNKGGIEYNKNDNENNKGDKNE
ncbi:MAG: homing endonuclease associated repeat-containing protein [archaeon]